MTGNSQDYVYDLTAAVRALSPEAYDSHLFALEVRRYPLAPLRAYLESKHTELLYSQRYRHDCASWIAHRYPQKIPMPGTKSLQ